MQSGWGRRAEGRMSRQVQKELGLSITPWQTSLIDMVVSLVEKGLATPVPAN